MPGRVFIFPMRAAWWVLLGVIAALVIALTWVPRMRQGEASTQIHIYSPEGFQAEREVEGNCWTGSIAAPRAGAFRCAAGNAIHDPCFPFGDAVACPQGDPADQRGLLMRLTEPLPLPPSAWENPPDPTRPSPWFTRLAGGGTCGVITGAGIAGFPLGCTLPEQAEGIVCMLPVPLAHRPESYVTVCGRWDDSRREVVDRRSYRVAVMWL